MASPSVLRSRIRPAGAASPGILRRVDAVQVILRIALFTFAGGVVGWQLGDTSVGIAVALGMVLLFWLLQMWRLAAWLQDSQAAPPEVWGIWGEIVSRIYKLQRDSRQNEERLQSMVDYLLESFSAMRDGVVIVEESGAIRWSNQAAGRLLGLRHPEDSGQAIGNLVRYPAFIDYLAEGDYDTPLNFEAGADENLHLQVVVSRFGEGDRLLFLRDTTQLVRMEQVRRDFVGNVSHELRTPLTVITGYLGTILADTRNLDPRYHKPLKQMAQQADRMENLLKDLLWLSRIESEERDEKHELVDVAALLEELCEELGNTYPDRSLSLEAASDFKVSGTYRELYSAVSNLVLNAFKYSPQSSPVTLGWRRVGDEYLLSVTDRGMGIEELHIPRLTERFYRVDDSRSSATGGTGLGLAIVKHVAAGHEAQLRIQSEPGKGSTFTLAFPATTAREPGDRR